MKGVFMSLRISAITGSRNPISAANISKVKNVAKQAQNANADYATKLACVMTMMMPAKLFLDSGTIVKDGKTYVEINGQWYEKHQPVDPSDYPCIIPSKPPKQESKYALS